MSTARLGSTASQRHLAAAAVADDDEMAHVQGALATAVAALARLRLGTLAFVDALEADLIGSCDQMTIWAEPGSGLLHSGALLVACYAVLALIGQLSARARHACAKCTPRVDEAKQPLLPVAISPGSAAADSAAPVVAESDMAALTTASWTSLACAELFSRGVRGAPLHASNRQPAERCGGRRRVVASERVRVVAG